MRTAVSLPDELFARVDHLARRRRTSRSRVFQDALRLYLSLSEPDLTRRIDEALRGAASMPVSPPAWGELSW